MAFDKKKYDKQYRQENTVYLKIALTHTDNDYFTEYCKSIGAGKSAYIKALINADAVKRGLLPIFTDKRSGKDYTLKASPDTSENNGKE